MTCQRKPGREVEILKKLSADICSVGERSICGSTTFLLVMDEVSRFKWAFLLRRKGDASAHLQALVRRLNMAPKEQATTLHSDQDGEFPGRELQAFARGERDRRTCERDAHGKGQGIAGDDAAA
ncbi:hypothetical protein PybrP1_013066 [[Pythium] brassicae (nom. inval.)]|nr:hypothetical protein PybrP1_013066 [[Pythium] brassicae (nom. inval.)]